MMLAFFVTNVYQLAVSRALICLFCPQRATVVYCREFINENNPFIRYLGSLEGVDLLSVSEKAHIPNPRLFRFKRPVCLDQQVLNVVRQSDMVFFGDPYLLSQRHYASLSRATALIEDSPTLFSYFRYRNEISVARRWLGMFLGHHPVFDAATTCYGFSENNNCPHGSYVNLLQALENDQLDVIRAEIRNEFQAEFDSLHLISALNDDNSILLLTQPLACDGIVGSVDNQVQFYLENIQQLHTAGFRVFCKLHPRDVANRVHYPIEPTQIFHFSSPMELFEDELRNSFVGIATHSSAAFAESTRFARITLSR